MNSPQPQMRSPQRLQIAGPPDCYHERDSDQTNQQDGSWEKDLKQQAIKEEEWGRHKQNFRDLYLTDGFKLNDVRRLMYQQYGFYATETQYKKRLSTIWKIQKNIPNHKMIAMLQIEHKRRLGPEKKLTLFSWHGKPVEKEKIERSRKRLRFTEDDNHSIVTPSCVSYRTYGSSSFEGNNRRPSQKPDKSVTSSASGLEIAPHPAQFLILPPIPSTLRPNFNNPIPEDLDIQTAQEWQDFDTLFGDPISDPHRNTEANDIPISHGIWVPSSTRLEGTGSIIPLSDELFEQVVNDVEAGETEQAPPTSPSTILHKASICNKLGHVFCKAGHFSDALDCYKSAYATASETFGHQHPNTLNALHNMGMACSELGDNYTAHIYLTHVLEEEEIVLKTDDPAISETQRQLSIVCYRQGNYAESQKFLEHALVVKERVLGHDHPSTLDIIHELGFLYCKQENYSLGYRYFQRAVSGRKKILGRGHSETLDSIMYLGSTLCYLKQYEEAFAWYDTELIAQNEELVGSGILSGDLRTNYIKAIVSMSIICCRLGYFDKGQECFHYISSLLGEETDQWVIQLDYPMHSDDDRQFLRQLFVSDSLYRATGIRIPLIDGVNQRLPNDDDSPPESDQPLSGVYPPPFGAHEPHSRPYRLPSTVNQQPPLWLTYFPEQKYHGY